MCRVQLESHHFQTRPRYNSIHLTRQNAKRNDTSSVVGGGLACIGMLDIKNTAFQPRQRQIEVIQVQRKRSDTVSLLETRLGSRNVQIRRDHPAFLSISSQTHHFTALNPLSTYLKCSPSSTSPSCLLQQRRVSPKMSPSRHTNSSK
jgi:hypothetical protein